MVQHRGDGFGDVVAQPAQAKRDDRPVRTRVLELLRQSVDRFAIVHLGDIARQVGARQRMDLCKIARDLAQQFVWPVHFENGARIGGTGQRAHDEAAADAIVRFQFDHYLGSGHPGSMRGADDRRLAVVAEGAPFHEREARRAPENQVLVLAGQPPALHRGSAGQSVHAFGCRPADPCERARQPLFERLRAFSLSHATYLCRQTCDRSSPDLIRV